MITLIRYFNYFILFYLLFVNLVYTAFFIVSIGSIYISNKKDKYWSYKDMIELSYTPPLSILVPCYNEDETIVDNVKALLSLEYGEFEIVIINDGSKDNTLKTLKEAFNLQSIDIPYRKQVDTKEVKGIYVSNQVENIIVIDKKNGGKADALNAGINVCQYPLFTAIDADSLIEQDALLKVVRPFIENPSVVVSGGTVRPVNGSVVDQGFIEEIRLPKNNLARFQVVEYLRAFLFGRMGWSAINALMIVSGAFGVFNKKVAVDAGGYTSDTIGEDMELIVKIHRIMKEQRKKYKVAFIPDPVCWTQVPEDKATLKNQRKRWHKGLIDTVINHKNLIFNPQYGVVGLLAIPYYVLIEMLGPIVEIIGYIFIPFSLIYGVINLRFALYFFALAVGYGIFLSIGAILLDEYSYKKYEKISEYLILVLYSILENLGYRQLSTWWRFIAIFEYKRKNNKWGDMNRKKFNN
ncbi:glycosyltransferase [Serpentinicella sp. ANB-PHB4]|uniref:glycosyltransferase family 2 protein n=1 Tax=Serpentinicella sp. ANB-PHB4 TaxID=3074076 RepID=UPI00285A497F|nr:glycosyltransferase [Serpentinicella sp. ANB-PHB4]MDR5659064.1 glycosyltransferase [Serpentinicella sp. ANB-PHB4]